MTKCNFTQTAPGCHEFTDKTLPQYNFALQPYPYFRQIQWHWREPLTIVPDSASRCYPEAAPHFEPPIQMVLLGQQDDHIQLALYALPHLRFGYTQPLNRRWREAITAL
ncbi:hypothetical protein [Aliikangiella maris]|uniref:Uncharacterized protein n=2 Tax=Aliikangiella maris TaxID=3162458 RepID=A0ABV2BZX5_9GAMM